MIGKFFGLLKDLFRPKFQTLKPEAFYRLFKKTNPSQVLDVRTMTEYASGHVRGSLNMDVNAKSFKQKMTRLDPSKTYFVHCKSGARSRMACVILSRQGFNVVNLMGGYTSIKDFFK